MNRSATLWLIFGAALIAGGCVKETRPLPVLPTGGWNGIFSRSAVLPVALLSIGPMAVFARQTRAGMLEVMGQDYIRTARAKGLSEKVVVLKHALRNALIPIVTVIGLEFGSAGSNWSMFLNGTRLSTSPL